MDGLVPSYFLIQLPVSEYEPDPAVPIGTMSDYSASDSYLGFAHQTFSALTLLLDSGDDDSVTLELTDDVTLHSPGSDVRHQIAHTISDAPDELSIKAVKLWKTIRIWATEYRSTEHYVLITCAPISQELMSLTDNSDRTQLQIQLEAEAARVIQEHDQKVHEHKDRYQGCKAFLALDGKTRSALVYQILLCPQSPNITRIDAALGENLKNIATPEKRQLIIVRLREFWLNRVVKSLTGELPRRISKREVQQQIEEIHNEITGPILPDDFGDLKPPEDCDTPDLMRTQIELVDGGPRRITRARRARWQSANQRQRWMDDKITFWSQLNRFDQKLVDVWSDRHGPMCDDTVDAPEEVKRRRGCEILDWSHQGAASTLIKIGNKVAPPFLVQGTYQQLADDRRVGWHPDYESLLPKREEPDEND
jgi:hypothetical protein